MKLMTKHGHYFDLAKAQTRMKEDCAGAESNTSSISRSDHHNQESSVSKGQPKVLLQNFETSISDTLCAPVSYELLRLIRHRVIESCIWTVPTTILQVPKSELACSDLEYNW
jgi:hypothetical protein